MTTEAYEPWDIRRIPIPADVERDIVTPHHHESMEVKPESLYGDQPTNRPLWLIWVREKSRIGVLYFPTLDSVADCEESARAHYRMAVEGKPGVDVSVERIPANHRFASSLGYWQNEAHVAQWKARAEYNKRVGD